MTLQSNWELTKCAPINLDSDAIYKIAFASLKGMNYRLGVDLLGRIGSEEIFFTTKTSQLKSLLGFNNRILEQSYRDSVLEKARIEYDFIKNNNIKLSYFTDNDNFPSRLTECDDSPIILYYLGENILNKAHIISVVGTRHATVYGIGFVKELVGTLARKRDNVVIVSGLAYGIDVTSHKEAIDNDIPTAAVLAHGLSTIYPADHRHIAARIVKSNGMLITDYPHDSIPYRPHFIARNRIVAGVADCTVVVESAEKGGAMITARIASGYNRDVFALPGRTSDPYSRGCNHLIRTHQAQLIQSPDELIEFMGWQTHDDCQQEQKLFYQLNPDEQKIVDFLTIQGEGFINRISVETGISMHRLMGLLIDMEFKGLVINQPGGLYRLA